MGVMQQMLFKDVAKAAKMRPAKAEPTDLAAKPPIKPPAAVVSSAKTAPTRANPARVGSPPPTLIAFEALGAGPVAADPKTIEPPPACPQCGSLALWQSAAAEDLRGLKWGRWRCLTCDPPRLAAWMDRLRRLLESKRKC